MNDLDIAEVVPGLAAVARRLLDDADTIDRSEKLPASHRQLLASAGLYGILAPVALGGLGLDERQVCRVVEELASACLASTFVWIQHLALLGALLDASTPPPLRAELLPRLVSGELTAGVVLAGLLPGPPRLVAEAATGGWLLSGDAPWVTGWGQVDELLVVARGPANSVVTLVVDPARTDGITATPQRLVALQASTTVTLQFAGRFVASSRVLDRRDISQARIGSGSLRRNGSLALGLARRCCALVGPSALDEEVSRCRDRLDESDSTTVAAGRARASELAARAASAGIVRQGSSAVIRGSTAERLAREAQFLLVFGSRPAIRTELLAALHAGAPTAVGETSGPITVPGPTRSPTDASPTLSS